MIFEFRDLALAKRGASDWGGFGFVPHWLLHTGNGMVTAFGFETMDDDQTTIERLDFCYYTILTIFD